MRFSVEIETDLWGSRTLYLPCKPGQRLWREDANGNWYQFQVDAWEITKIGTFAIHGSRRWPLGELRRKRPKEEE